MSWVPGLGQGEALMSAACWRNESQAHSLSPAMATDCSGPCCYYSLEYNSPDWQSAFLSVTSECFFHSVRLNLMTVPQTILDKWREKGLNKEGQKPCLTKVSHLVRKGSATKFLVSCNQVWNSFPVFSTPGLIHHLPFYLSPKQNQMHVFQALESHLSLLSLSKP